MQIIATTTPASTNLPTSVKQFTIKASAKAFMVLMAQVYSDKVTAVIREICSNAYDAHAMSGTPEVPFKVDLPSALNPMFSVRDYGIGMDEATVFGLYSTFFESNKEHTNDAVGCLGLGSKSPFAVSDSFFVTTFSGERKLSFMVFLDQNIPSISKVDDSPCDEPRGVEIKFAVPANQFYEYDRKATAVFKSFSVMPILNGVLSSKPAPKLSGKNWELHITGGSNQTVVRQGCVEYPLVYSSSTYGQMPHGTKLVLIAPIGSVAITPSRESLSYDTMTVATVESLRESALAELSTVINALITEAGCLSALERMKIASEFSWMQAYSRYSTVSGWNTINLVPCGNKATRSVTAETLAAYAIRRASLLGNVRANHYYYVHQFNSTEIDRLKLFFIPDMSVRGLKGRIEQEVRQHGSFSYVSDIASFKRIIRVLGLQKHQTKYVSDLPFPPKQEKVKSTAPKMSKFYALSGDRFLQVGVPKEYLWVTKVGRERFVDSNNIEVNLTLLRNFMSATKRTLLCVNPANVDKVDQTKRLSLKDFLDADETTLQQVKQWAMHHAIDYANFSNDAKDALRSFMHIQNYREYPLAVMHTCFVDSRLADTLKHKAIKHLHATYPDLLPLSPPTPTAIASYITNPSVSLQR